ncbi:MAG TPA: hypothetical protein VKE40_03510 [Gemmataceae bacterium]|nr:hypothetical protein [Gemmataceae bacterium]
MLSTRSTAVAVAPPDSCALRAGWTKELYVVAEAIRLSGRLSGLRDVTIVHPIDHTALAAIDLACRAIAAGELSGAARELDRFLNDLAADPAVAAQFLPAVRSVARRAASSDRWQ